MFGLADSQSSAHTTSCEARERAKSARAPMEGEWFEVLVVDDDPAVSARLCRTLEENRKTRVTLCSSGDEAARLLGLECALPTLKPDLCLLAAEVPGLTGIDLLSLMRRNDDLMAIPVALVLHSDDERMTYRAMDEGANGIIAAHAGEHAYCDAVRRIADFWRRVRPAS